MTDIRTRLMDTLIRNESSRHDEIGRLAIDEF